MAAYHYRQTIGATVRSVFTKQKKIFTNRLESTVNIAVKQRTAGATFTKLATVAAVLIVTATMTAATKLEYGGRFWNPN